MPEEPTQNTAWRIEPFDLDSPFWPGAIDVYTRTWLMDRDRALYFFTRQASRPDFRGLVAVAGDEVVGMVFGSHSQPGQWWYDHVALRLGEDHPALQDAWMLTELAVAPEWRGQGIGAALHDAVLAAQPCTRVLLSTEVSNDLARDMYEHRGWRYLHPGFAFEPGRPEFAIMHRSLSRETDDD
jgi:ribosomal protein S18 acetylase RimI-like enzyme